MSALRLLSKPLQRTVTFLFWYIVMLGIFSYVRTGYVDFNDMLHQVLVCTTTFLVVDLVFEILWKGNEKR